MGWEEVALRFRRPTHWMRVHHRDSKCRPTGLRLAMACGLGLALEVPHVVAQPNPIVIENTLPGSPPSAWDVTGAGDYSIQGFATEISVAPGDVISFKVDTPATDYRLDIYRVGYYGGSGARHVATVQPSVPLPQAQPACLNDPATRLTDCGSWAVSATWTVPGDAVSGIYIAKLVREDPEDGRASHILFVVRDDDGASDILFQTSDTTWQAYNRFGGTSLYTTPRAYKVSYNRPVTVRETYAWNSFFNAEYPTVRWLERNGYDVSYTTGVDSDRRGAEILEHRVFLSVGHDEYWSRGQRQAVTAARDAGVHLAFLSGNEIYWKTRWEPSNDGSSAPYRTLVCYKESHQESKIDPLPNVWTGWWRDCRFSPPADGCDPENRLSGQISWSVLLCGGTTCGIQVPDTFKRARLWRHTSIADLPPGQFATFPAGTLGHEWDYEQFEDDYPAGRVWLSSTTVSGLTHHLSLYRHASGALVFGAGTIQWAWGLDDHHTHNLKPPAFGGPPDPRMQQATVNLLAEMDALPGTLQPDLVEALPTGDRTPAVSSIDWPADGNSVPCGSLVIRGTAADGQGVVGVVEVSVDSGVTWRHADGFESWSYTWIAPPDAGPQVFMCRAADDLGNLQASPAAVGVTVGGPRLAIVSVASEDSIYMNGIDVARLLVTTRSNWYAEDSLELRATLCSNRGDRFDLGADRFAVEPRGQHTSEFLWPLPAASHTWEFAIEATLSQRSSAVATASGPAAFTGMLMSRAELQQAIDLLTGPAGCLGAQPVCETMLPGVTPHCGTMSQFLETLPALCRTTVEMEAGRPARAGVAGLAACSAVIERGLESLAQGGLTADVVPSDVRAAISCYEWLAASGLTTGTPSPSVHDRVDSLAAAVRSLFADLERPYSLEAFVGGPAGVRLGIDGHWTSRLEVGLRDACVYDLAPAAIAWGHLGAHPAPLGCEPPCAGAIPNVEIDATSNGALEIALLYRTSADSVVWIRYEPIAVGPSSRLWTEFAGDPLYPWGFGLRVDSNGDGTSDDIVYPSGVTPSSVESEKDLRFRILPGRPNPFQPATTIRYVLPAAGPVTVDVFDVRGRIVRTLLHSVQAAGVQEAVWDGRSAGGDRVPGGTYLVRVVSTWGAASEKVTVVR